MAEAPRGGIAESGGLTDGICDAVSTGGGPGAGRFDGTGAVGKLDAGAVFSSA